MRRRSEGDHSAFMLDVITARCSSPCGGLVQQALDQSPENEKKVQIGRNVKSTVCGGEFRPSHQKVCVIFAVKKKKKEEVGQLALVLPTLEGLRGGVLENRSELDHFHTA